MQIPLPFCLVMGVVLGVCGCSRKQSGPGSSSPPSSDNAGAGMSAGRKKPVQEDRSGARPPPGRETAAFEVQLSFSKAHRPVTTRAKLPKVVVPLLPKRGIYAAGGGLVSGSWRVVFDLDSRVLFAGSNPRQSSKSFGPMPKHKKVKLGYEQARALVRLADRVWRGKHPVPTRPMVDYQEIIIIVDGSEAYLLEGYGPMRSSESKALIKDLRSYGF